MILLAACLIKVVLTASVALFVMWGNCGKWSRRGISLFLFATIVFALAANIAAEKLPPLTDEVTLTALGETNGNAAEVVLNGYTVDDHPYTAGKSLQIVEGKWLWSGERYMWRTESDSRQPSGLTRTITIRIPAGWNRELNFHKGQWCGPVEISVGGEKQIVDTFKDCEAEAFVPIEKSASSVLIWNQIRMLALFGVLLLIYLKLSMTLVRLVMQKPESFQKWHLFSTGKLLYAAIALLSFCIMFRYADNASLWADELCKIGIVRKDIGTAIGYCLDMKDIAPPLYCICAWVWYHIAPYGERWLLLLSIIPVMIAIYVMGLIGEKLRGKACGMIAASLLAFSMTVWGFIAFEFRNYTFALLFSTLSLYCHIQKNREGERKAWLTAYSISLTALAMSHYFGMLLCGVFFLADLYLYVTKRISRRSVFSYILPGIISLLWLYLVYQRVLRFRGTETIASWYPVPTLMNIGSLLKFLSGNILLSFCLFLLGMACVLANIRRTGSFESDLAVIYQRFSLAAILIVIGLLYIYGNYINQKSTMWQDRYFLVLIPFIVLISALGVTDLLSDDDHYQRFRVKAVCILLVIILGGNIIVTGSYCGITYQPFRAAADWLYTQSNDIFAPDTVIIQTSTDLLAAGWNEYYVSRQGRRDPLNVITQNAITAEKLQSYRKVYVQYSHSSISEPVQSALDANFTLEADLPEFQLKVYVRNF